MTTANLAVADNDTVIQYEATASQDEFDFNFPILSGSELKVSVDQVLKTLGVDYTIDGLGDAAGGTITFVDPLDGGELVTLWLEMPISRLTGFALGAATLLPQALNTEFARQVRIDQMLRRDIGRSLRVPVDDPEQGQSLLLPTASARAGKYLRFATPSGNPEVATELAAGTTLSQSTIGEYFYPQSDAEALLSIVNFFKPYGHVERYGTYVDASTDFSAAIQAAFSVAHKHVVQFTENRVYRADSDLVFPGQHGLMVQGNRASIDSYSSGDAVSFTLVGSIYPISCTIRNLNVNVNGGVGRTGFKVRASYSLMEGCTVTLRNTATDAVGFDLVGDEATGSGPYYNNFMGCNVGGTLASQVAVLFSAVAPNYRGPNANCFYGGRYYATGGVAFRITGAGNNFFGGTIEGGTVTAFDFVSPVASKCVNNKVFGAYIESVTNAFVFDSASTGTGIFSPYLTGITNLWTDASAGVGGHIFIGGNQEWRIPRGLMFGALSTDANALDYYGEGSFTPTVTFTTPGDVASTPTANNAGRYTRVGNRVHFTIDLDLSSITHTTASGALRIGGLPFAAAAGQETPVSLGSHNSAVTYSGGRSWLTPVVLPATQQVHLYQSGSGVSSTDIAAANITSGGTLRIRLAGSYRV
jgi:hypothetical protein